MSRNYTDSHDDNVLDTCWSFGGTAADCAGVAENLDAQLTVVCDKIEALEDEIAVLKDDLIKLRHDQEGGEA